MLVERVIDDVAKLEEFCSFEAADNALLCALVFGACACGYSVIVVSSTGCDDRDRNINRSACQH